jgi:hypothetical protein
MKNTNTSGNMDPKKRKKSKKSSNKEKKPKPQPIRQHNMSPETVNYLIQLTFNVPGSIVATEDMYNYNPSRALRLYSTMKNMGMNGSKIWAGYKFYGRDVEKFMNGVENRDHLMIEYINKAVRAGGCGNAEEITL